MKPCARPAWTNSCPRWSRNCAAGWRLVSGYDVLYGQVKAFVREQLFDRSVELESPNTLRNLSELAATKTLIETFKKAINALTVQDKGDAEIRDTIKLRQTRPFVAKDQGYLIPKKSVFNRIIGDSRFELGRLAYLGLGNALGDGKMHHRSG